MNIVDVIICCNKFNNMCIKRHTSSSHNISSFYCLEHKFINNNTKHIINVNFINRKNVNILIKCAKYKIKVISIIYWMDNMDLQKLINYLIKINDFSIIRRNTNILYTKQNFQLNDNEACLMACKNGHLNIVKYLHKEIGLEKEDFQLNNNEACRMACAKGHIDVVKYLYKEIRLEKEDFQSHVNNKPCKYACTYGHIDVVKYLHQNIGLEKEDFQSDNNYACRWACSYGHLNIVKYLHREIGLTNKDFQANKNEACRTARINGRVDVVKYLRKEIKVPKCKL